MWVIPKSALFSTRLLLLNRIDYAQCIHQLSSDCFRGRETPHEIINIKFMLEILILNNPFYIDIIRLDMLLSPVFV